MSRRVLLRRQLLDDVSTYQPTSNESRDFVYELTNLPLVVGGYLIVNDGYLRWVLPLQFILAVSKLARLYSFDYILIQTQGHHFDSFPYNADWFGLK